MERIELTLVGVKDVLDRVSLFDEQVVRKFNRVVKEQADQIAALGRSLIPAQPMKNWKSTPSKTARKGRAFPEFNQAQVRAGITTNRKPGRATGASNYKVSGANVLNKNPGGGIFEVAGRRNPSGNSASGAQFIANLNKVTSDTPSRGIWEATDRLHEKVYYSIELAFEEVKSDLQRFLRS